MFPLGKINGKLNISIKRNIQFHCGAAHLVKLETFLNDINTRMGQNFLMFNPVKIRDQNELQDQKDVLRQKNRLDY